MRLDRIGSLLPIHSAWKTVRDAVHDLPNPEDMESARILNHDFAAGAKSYAGHTGSPLDEPAKTLKAGDHGVPGGENMLRLPSGRVRYFTVRESARLQGFPDEFISRIVDGDNATTRKRRACTIGRGHRP